MRKRNAIISLGLTGALLASAMLPGCGTEKAEGGKIEIEMVSYKQEAVEVFEELEQKFNETHDDIHLSIESPNDAMTILRTKFIREEYPDIIAIGGDVNYSNFVDAGILADVSDFEGLDSIQPAYVDILENLEYVPTEGTFGVPFVANAAGVLYNRDMFREHGWEIPETWGEFTTLCDQIQAEGILPLYFGFRDSWTCLAPWNALAVGLAPYDICQQVNRGETTFSEAYPQIAEKMLELLPYAEEGPVGYNYNDACTAFAKGQSAMYTIGSYAIPQIKSVNPDMNIDSFVMPANDTEEENVLNSGVDLQFCVMESSEHKEAAYEVMNFLLENENVQYYIDDQNAVPCKNDSFELAPELDGMEQYITEGRMSDYQDHYYPSEMAVDAQIQTFLLNGDVDKFLKKFDTDWKRYNRDVIRKVEDYEAEHGNE